MDTTIAVWTGLALTIFFGFTLILVALGQQRDGVEKRLREVTGTAQDAVLDDDEDERKRGPLAVLSSVVQPVRRVLGLSSDPVVAQNLAKLGYDKPHHQDMYYAAKLLGPALAAVLAGTVFAHNALFAFFALATIAFFLPDLWLSSRIIRWREAIRLSLPDALDLLVITMEAGLALDQALLRVANEMKSSHPELAAELLTINLEQRAGKRRLEAWQHMADRTQLDVTRAFTNMLLQTERFGTPIASALGKFADSMRTQRRQQAEELAAKTTIKLVFPLVLFIFPSMFIVMLAPAIIAIVEGLGKTIQ